MCVKCAGHTLWEYIVVDGANIARITVSVLVYP